MEGSGFRDHFAEYENSNTAVLGASFDKPEDSRGFAEKYKFPFPLLSDTERQVGMSYGACDTTNEEYARRIAYLIGPDGTILQAHEKVNPAKYPLEQLEYLKGASKPSS